LVSTAATRAPPRPLGSNAKKFSSSAPSTPLMTRTWGAPPVPAPVMMSSTPSSLRSTVLTFTPSRNFESNAKKFSSGLPVSSPSKAVTRGAPPARVPTMMSSIPLPFTSPEPTFTPPRKESSKAKKSRMVLPVATSMTTTRGPPLVPAPVMRSLLPSSSMSPIASDTPPVNVGS
jgi:hypothetical protein